MSNLILHFRVLMIFQFTTIYFKVTLKHLTLNRINVSPKKHFKHQNWESIESLMKANNNINRKHRIKVCTKHLVRRGVYSY